MLAMRANRLPPGQRHDSKSLRAFVSFEYFFASVKRFSSSALNFVFMLTKCATQSKLCQQSMLHFYYERNIQNRQAVASQKREARAIRHHAGFTGGI